MEAIDQFTPSNKIFNFKRVIESVFTYQQPKMLAGTKNSRLKNTRSLKKPREDIDREIAKLGNPFSSWAGRMKQLLLDESNLRVEIFFSGQNKKQTNRLRKVVVKDKRSVFQICPEGYNSKLPQHMEAK